MSLTYSIIILQAKIPERVYQHNKPLGRDERMSSRSILPEPVMHSSSKITWSLQCKILTALDSLSHLELETIACHFKHN